MPPVALLWVGASHPPFSPALVRCPVGPANHGGLGWTAAVTGTALSLAAAMVVLLRWGLPAACLRSATRSPVRALRVAIVLQVWCPPDQGPSLCGLDRSSEGVPRAGRSAGVSAFLSLCLDGIGFAF